MQSTTAQSLVGCELYSWQLPYDSLLIDILDRVVMSIAWRYTWFQPGGYPFLRFRMVITG